MATTTATLGEEGGGGPPALDRIASTSQLPDLAVLTRDAEASAYARVADALRFPEDLGTPFVSLRRRFHAEHMAVQAQLAASVQAQLADAARGLATLADTRASTAAVIANLAQLSTLCAGSQNHIANYARIKLVSRTHQNFLATRSMVERLQHLSSRVDRVSRLFDEDRAQLVGPAHNLLSVHVQLTDLAAFRNKVLANARSPEIAASLNTYFRKLNELTTDHDEYLCQLAENIINLARAGHESTVTRLVKLIESEATVPTDTALGSIGSSVPTVVTATSNKTTSPGEQQVRSTEKSFRERFFDVLRKNIVDKVHAIYDRNVGNITKLLDELMEEVSVLVYVNLEIVPLFPEKYNILHFYVLEYHRSIYDVVSKLITKQLEASTILQLLKWVKDYYEMLNVRLGVSEELLEPRLLDNKDAELSETYISLVKSKVNEWMTNILRTETLDFAVRKEPPETDVDMKYLLSGSVIVFQMFNQQIDLVSTSSRGKLLYEVVSECVSALGYYRQEWLAAIEAEHKKFSEKLPAQSEGFPEYLIALANDCFRCIEFVESLNGRLDSMLDEPYLGKIKSGFDTAADGLMDVCERVVKELVDIVMTDIRPAFQALFTSVYYEREITRLITGTIQDYADDYKVIAHDMIFGKFTSELLDAVALEYLSAFRNKSVKFKMPKAVERMKADVGLLSETMSQYRSTNRVSNVLMPIRKVIGMLECNNRMVLVGVHTLLKEYGDIPYDMFESLVSRRDDMDKTQSREVLDVVREKLDEQKNTTVVATVFSKLLPPQP